jgi:hypothetical protein
MTTIPQNPWPEPLRARFRERGYKIDEPPEEFPVARGMARTWGYVHPQTGEAVVFVEGRQDARVWRADRVCESRARRLPPATAADTGRAAGAQTGDAAASLDTRYLDLLRRERALVAELRLVKAERERIERELAKTMLAARTHEAAIGPVRLTPRARLAVRVTGDRLRVEDLRESGLPHCVHESVDYSALRRYVAEAIQTHREEGVTIEAARQRFFDAHPRLAGKLSIEEEAQLSLSGERRLYSRDRLGWTAEEDAALLAEYRGGVRLHALVSRYERPPSAIAARLTTLLWGADGAETPPEDVRPPET